MKKTAILWCAALSFAACKKDNLPTPQTTQPGAVTQTVMASNTQRKAGALNDPNNVDLLLKYLNDQDPTHCTPPAGLLENGSAEQVLTLKNFNLYYEPGDYTPNGDAVGSFRCPTTWAICYFTRITGKLEVIKGPNTGLELEHEYLPASAVIIAGKDFATYHENAKVNKAGDTYSVVSR